MRSGKLRFCFETASTEARAYLCQLDPVNPASSLTCCDASQDAVSSLQVAQAAKNTSANSCSSAFALAVYFFAPLTSYGSRQGC